MPQKILLKVLIIINDLLYVFDLFYESLYKSMSFPLSGELLAGGRAGVGAGGGEGEISTPEGGTAELRRAVTGRRI